MQTTIAHEIFSYSKVTDDFIDISEELKKILYLDSGFSGEVIKDLTVVDTYKHTTEKRKNEIYCINHANLNNNIFETQFKNYSQELCLPFNFDTLVALREETKKLTTLYSHAVFKTTIDPKLNPPNTSKIELFGLFPTAVSTYQYSGDLSQELSFVENSNYYLNLNNLSTNKNLHTYKEIEALSKFFTLSVQSHLELLGYYTDDVIISQCWANKTTYGHSHHLHSHPNSFLSGIFYLTSFGGADTVFNNSQTSLLSPTVLCHSVFNSGTFEVKPYKGLLALFPSQLRHSTLANLSEQTRYSISFNVFFGGMTGDWRSASWSNSPIAQHLTWNNSNSCK